MTDGHFCVLDCSWILRCIIETLGTTSRYARAVCFSSLAFCALALVGLTYRDNHRCDLATKPHIYRRRTYCIVCPIWIYYTTLDLAH